MFSKQTVAFAAGISTASAAIYQGFNYGSQTDFPTEFALAKDLAGTNGAFASARLYTTIDATNANLPTSAIPAAIAADVTLLLGVWASAGQPTISSEIAAINAAIATYGTDFTSRVVGISVGSEDLYRNSPTGIINKSGAGANPDDLVNYIGQVRNAIKGTGLANVPVGHVDTWTAWVNGSNDAVISACDFLGMDAYPYFQTSQGNTIEAASDLFFSAYDQTVGAAMGKDVWVTETGWPASGPTAGVAVPSIANAETYWQAVACKLLGKTNTWWYTLNDAGAAPSFGVTTGSTTPLYDLSCKASASSSSSSSLVASSSASMVASSVSSSVVASSSGIGSSSSAAASSVIASSASSLSSQESTAAPSNTLFSVTSSAVPSQIGGGSPGDTTSIAADSTAASVATASPSLQSSLVSSASSAASAAATNSSATIPVGTGSMATSATAASASGSSSGSHTTTAVVPPYTGGASTLRSTGGVIAAIVALVAAL